MKTSKKLKFDILPKITYDKKLDKLENVILFPESVERAKKILAKIGLPKELQ